MCTVMVESRFPGLLERGVAALIREIRPEWLVEIVEAPAGGRAGVPVRLSIADSSRWMAVLRREGDIHGAASALDAGAAAVLGPQGDLEQFDYALGITWQGTGTYVPAELARGLAREGVRAVSEVGPGAATTPRLTPRETQVLELVAAGFNNHEIAGRLGLSVNTVRGHLQTLSVKLGTPGRASIVANAVENLSAQRRKSAAAS